MGKNKENVIVKRTDSVVISIPPTPGIPIQNVPIIVSNLLRKVSYNPGGYDFSLDTSTDMTTIKFYFFIEEMDKVNTFLEDLKDKFPDATSFFAPSLLLIFDKIISQETALRYSMTLAKVGDILLYATLNNEIAVVYSSLNDERQFFGNINKLIKQEFKTKKVIVTPHMGSTEDSVSHKTPLYISPPYYGAVKRL